MASNSKDTVEQCSRKAFSLLPDVQAAIAELSTLRGVGPATASGAHMLCIQDTEFTQPTSVTFISDNVHFVPAVLAAVAPEEVAFMSDEGMESVPGLKPIQYTTTHYALYLQKMVEKAKNLNKGKT